MRLYFARHGESEANILRVISNRARQGGQGGRRGQSPQHGLTDLGREQAAALASAVRGAVSVVYCSPLLRAVETAQVVGAALGVQPEESDALREYDCGILEGRGDDESWKAHAWFSNEWLHGRHRDLAPKGGETFEQIRSRFVPFVDSLVRTQGRSELGILLIGHGGLYRLMLPVVLSNVDHAFVRERGFDNAAVVIAEERGRSLTCIEWCGVPV